MGVFHRQSFRGFIGEAIDDVRSIQAEITHVLILLLDDLNVIPPTRDRLLPQYNDSTFIIPLRPKQATPPSMPSCYRA